MSQKIVAITGVDDQLDTLTTISHALASAKQKIRAINEDVLNSRGLTEDEADVAIEAGLIAADQKYWWLEDWQKRHRRSEAEIEKGCVHEFDSPKAFLNSLGKGV